MPTSPTDPVDEGRYEPRRKRIKAYLDCPTCPLCGNATAVCADAYGQPDPTTLKCLACGEYFKGTDEQVEQARRADAAWERRQREDARGPRSVVVRRRRKKPTDQLPLFAPKEDKP